MVSAALTDRQASILAFISASIDRQGFPPTVREIGAEFGIRSPNGVMCHLKCLEKKGVIVREASAARAIQIRQANPVSLKMPFLGKVS